MEPLVRYYLHQEGRGKHDGIEPIYAASRFFSGDTGSAFFWQGYGEWLDRSSGVVPEFWGERRYVPEAIF